MGVSADATKYEDAVSVVVLLCIATCLCSQFQGSMVCGFISMICGCDGRTRCPSQTDEAPRLRSTLTSHDPSQLNLTTTLARTSAPVDNTTVMTEHCGILLS